MRRSMSFPSPAILAGVVVFWSACHMVKADPAQDLFIAARAGDVARVNELLADAPDLVNTKTRNGDTPLFAAVERFQLQSVEALLKAGAEVSGVYRRDWKLLHAVAFFGDEKSVTSERRRAIAALLIEHGADVSATDGRQVTPLHMAAMKARMELLPLFLSAKADINAKNRHEQTPLHTAAIFNRPKVIRWLIKHKADISAKDKMGDTALHKAVERFRKEATVVLIEIGADPNTKNDRWRTPLHLTALAGPSEEEVDALMATVAEALLKRGADPKAWDDANRTTLQYAKEKGRTRVAAVLERYLQK